MKHKIRIVDFSYSSGYVTRIEIDGELLFNDGTYLFNCLPEILTKLGIEYEIDYDQEYETTQIEHIGSAE